MAAIFFLTLAGSASAQQFSRQQKELESRIEAAYKKKQITALEYKKLKDEQATIRYTIEKYAADGVTTVEEKNRINAKLVRAKKRLAKYKRNREVY